MAIALSSFLFFSLLLLPSISAQSTAPPPGPARPINLTAILEKGGQFTTFIHLLNTTKMNNQVTIQLNSSNEGMTIFAPTDNAFNNLKPGTLNGLTTQQQVQLVLYHITTKFYSLNDLLSVSNPVRTLASGQNGGVFGLNFTGEGNQLNVTTGVVETAVNNFLRQQFPLAVYVVDKVLLPEELFGTKTTSGAPAPKSNSSSDNSGTADAPTTNSDQSSSGGRNTGLGLVLGFVWFCFMVL